MSSNRALWFLACFVFGGVMSYLFYLPWVDEKREERWHYCVWEASGSPWECLDASPWWMGY